MQNEATPQDKLRAAAELHAAGRYAEAAPLWQELVSSAPAEPMPRIMLAAALKGVGDWPQAITAYEAAQKLAPLPAVAESDLLLARLTIADWREYQAGIARLKRHVESGAAINPSILLYAAEIGPDLLLRSARAMAREISTGVTPLPPPQRSSSARIRLGYISADFKPNHPVGRHMIDVAQRHDRSRFEVFGYSLAPDGPRLAAFTGAVDHMRILQADNDAAAAARIRADGIEILVDLGGYQSGARPGVLAHRPAPLQANFFGSGVSMGADFIDYIVADECLIPQTAAGHYAEAVVRLPGTYFPGYWARPEAKPLTRARLGLPDTALVFCAFAAQAKITPAVFALWLELLKQVPKSVLWLKDHHPVATASLRAHAAEAGLAPERLVFVGNISETAYFGALALADLFLDTFPYGAGSTAADVLWAGVPVLTCLGESYVSRMAAAVVTGTGLTSLITADPEAYFSRAIELAYDRAALADYRGRLLEHRAELALFDSARYVRNLDAAYAEMSRKFRAGERPVAFAVPG